MAAAEKKISAFCARNGIRYEWQTLKYDGRRAVIATLDRREHETLLKLARRLSGVRVTEWNAHAPDFWTACIYLQDADAAADADARAAREKAHHESWWTANHAARLAGMDASAAARHAETLYPTPAAF